MIQWIDLKQKLPSKGQWCLIYSPHYFNEIAKFDGTAMRSRGRSLSLTEITHWMPLPEPPK